MPPSFAASGYFGTVSIANNSSTVTPGVRASFSARIVEGAIVPSFRRID
jgi:hypothetical protein